MGNTNYTGIKVSGHFSSVVNASGKCIEPATGGCPESLESRESAIGAPHKAVDETAGIEVSRDFAQLIHAQRQRHRAELLTFGTGGIVGHAARRIQVGYHAVFMADESAARAVRSRAVMANQLEVFIQAHGKGASTLRGDGPGASMVVNVPSLRRIKPCNTPSWSSYYLAVSPPSLIHSGAVWKPPGGSKLKKLPPLRPNRPWFGYPNTVAYTGATSTLAGLTNGINGVQNEAPQNASTANPLGTAGQITTTLNVPRHIQFALKVIF